MTSMSKHLVVYAYTVGNGDTAYSTVAVHANTRLQAMEHFRKLAKDNQGVFAKWTRIIDILDAESVLFDRKTSDSASETCQHCGKKIRVVAGFYPTIWVDETDGEECLQITEHNQTHSPASEVK